ncbi:MAG: class I SAM-dependent methyltransferase [Pelatocladus maniniholoensis HA4357-MV3]|jgi:2-polyprenyl-3-methyl-5-hydroxy-6-metoxy-1,4-benzoquinol methylase|uniref:Class I SAM-dependent methyltransferase n=1 Tax=Pelatocladus maniniholoensis HA4357-MV3 TaxID=1117104 RepID=A0A9E3HBZ8_9NOST|nr:class I SAM-dependent methyltransferase [Pelatocladus maniniholoensis HA4357-MV3]BAZ68733.1 type 11 methyltransferase [Fischerella sp. NIES-4106]
MIITSEKDYPLLPSITIEELDENSSLKKMLHWIGENKRVIDFGCATGYFARLLSSKGCQVTGIEINPKAAKIAEEYCEEVIVADLDFVTLRDILSGQTFDVAVFGDILEHLRNPWRILEEIKQILQPGGYVVASIPNIAHGAIRLALLQGKFEYTELGILDNTHLRFFTRQTVTQLFERSGYFVDTYEQIKLPIFSGSDWIPYIDKNKIDINIINTIEQDEDADTLQFVLRAFPLSLEGKYSSLYQQYSQLSEEYNYCQNQLKEIYAEFKRSQFDLEDKQIQLEKTQTQLEQSQSQLQEIQQQWQNTQTQLHQAHTAWEHCQNIIKAMESSKFWKLRQAWFKLKKAFILQRGSQQ